MEYSFVLLLLFPFRSTGLQLGPDPRIQIRNHYWLLLHSMDLFVYGTSRMERVYKFFRGIEILYTLLPFLLRETIWRVDLSQGNYIFGM